MRFKGQFEKWGAELCRETDVSSRITCSWSRCRDTPAEEGQAYSSPCDPSTCDCPIGAELCCPVTSLPWSSFGPEGPHSASLPLLVHSSTLSI